MVDIIIGSVPPMGPSTKKPDISGKTIEAEILNIRIPRQKITKREGEERRRQFRRDPIGGRILTILISNSSLLPHDISSARYKIRLNFVKK